jgi:hypothetical protein
LLYTVGFGYSDFVSHTFVEKFKNLKGALYTSDYLFPSFNHESNISWVTFFDELMLHKLSLHLTRTEEITYSGKFTNCNYDSETETVDFKNYRGTTIEIYNNFILKTPNRAYCETNVLTGSGYNCLTWAANILGVELNCGLMNSPAVCEKLNKHDFDQIVKGIKGELNLFLQIEKIQIKLKNNITNIASKTYNTVMDVYNRVSSKFTSINKRKSPKRKSPKRKSPKRKSPKRKSPKRKSPKRKSSKSKFSKRKSSKRKSSKRKSSKRKSRVVLSYNRK